MLALPMLQALDCLMMLIGLGLCHVKSSMYALHKSCCAATILVNCGLLNGQQCMTALANDGCYSWHGDVH